MSFTFGQALEVSDPQRIAMIGSAFRKTGKPVVLVPVGARLHAGHIALVRAAKAIRGAVVVAAMPAGAAAADDVAGAGAADGAGGVDCVDRVDVGDVAGDVEVLRGEGVDVVWTLPGDAGSRARARARVRVYPLGDGLEPADELAADLTFILGLVGRLRPTDIILGEKDYELLVAVNNAVADLALGARVQGVPTVRTHEGVAMSLRNRGIGRQERDRVAALSAALTAGAHAAEAGADKVIEVASAVLAQAGVTPEYLALRGRDFGPAPVQGDARLLVAATIGKVRLIDNVGLPLGIGFRGVEEHAAQAELAREQARARAQAGAREQAGE